MQLTLEQHVFEVNGSTYMWIFSIPLLEDFLEIYNSLKKLTNHVDYKYQQN